MSDTSKSSRKAVDALSEKLQESIGRLDSLLLLVLARKQKIAKDRDEILMLSRKVRHIIDRTTGGHSS